MGQDQSHLPRAESPKTVNGYATDLVGDGGMISLFILPEYFFLNCRLDATHNQDLLRKRTGLCSVME